MRPWTAAFTERARRQRLLLNRVTRTVLDQKLARLAEAPWLWGKLHNPAMGLWTTRYGWYGTVVYSIVPERHALVVQDCRWVPPPGHPDHDRKLRGVAARRR